MKAFVTHVRIVKLDDDYAPFPQEDIKLFGWGDRVHPRGGATFVKLIENGEVVAEGEAWCSDKDNYNKRLGRTIAEGRARKRLGKVS